MIQVEVEAMFGAWS